MNLAHLHLLLNHFPTVGTVTGLGIFLVSLLGRNEELQRVSLAIFFLLALVSIPVYMSGNAAQDVIKDLPGVSRPLIQAHLDAALLAFVFMEITGAVAWFGLWQFRRISRPTRWNLSAVLVLSLVTFGLMARAADLGGAIRHSEIRSVPETTTAAGTLRPERAWLNAAAIANFVNNKEWVWPTLQIIHFLGLCLLFGVVLLVNLRMLGMIKGVSFAALHQLLPFGILGFAIDLATGMLFFIAKSDQYTQNVPFYWKMGLVFLAGVNVLYFMFFDEAWAVGPGDDARPRTKLVAVSALVLWVGVMYMGRMLAFIGNAF